MTKQVISLSDQAANRIKEIMSSAENGSIGVRVGVKSGDAQECLILWNTQKKLILMMRLLRIRE